MKKTLYALLLLPIVGLAQTTTENFIKTTTYKGAGATLPVSQVTYFDGLGRPIQQIANAQSSTGKDIVTHIEYDAFGRQAKEFLPFPGDQNTMLYINAATAQTATTTHYTNLYGDNNPYSEKVFEPSPLNRVLEQAAPGTDWGISSPVKHTIRLDYQTNTATEVKYHKATATWNAASGLYDISLTPTTNYAANQLYKTITKDENWTAGSNNTTEEFKNKEGQVVLKRTYNAGAAHDTYYVYDQYNNLTYVLPPLAEGAITPEVLDGLCYQYKYDYRNRLVEKKLPAKQWEFIVYDKLDRPVATGPAFSPWGDGTVGILVTQYDAFGRVTTTGWKAFTVTTTARNSWQTSINSGTDPFVLATADVLTKNYYDNYTFPSAPTLPTTLPNSTYPIAQNVKGLATGSWVRLLDTPTGTLGETSYTLYDDKYRPVRTYTKNHLGGFTQVDSNLDFIGKTLYTVITHKRLNADALLTIKDMFTYSAQDRLLLHKQQINTLPEQLIASNTYDELGQLVSKNVGGTDVTGTLGLQKVDYSYNIRGWLKGINDMASLTQGTNPTDLFAFKLSYNDAVTATKLYNGNISETFWNTSSDNVIRKYNYTYDNLNRLLDASYSKPGVSTFNSYKEALNYDKNSNIMSLLRHGSIDTDGSSPVNPIDNLAYNYDLTNKNQLLKVFDSTNSPQGFKDDTTGTSDPADDYTYDANGNMKTDTNKGITTINYNHLNLPTKLFFGTNTIEYLYNATGQKIQKKVIEGATTTVTHYLSGFQYKNDVLQFFSHAEGYVNNTAGVFSYVFNYTDHLGNVRLSYQDKNKDGTIAKSKIQIPNSSPDCIGCPVDTGFTMIIVDEIIEENNYYPFGLKHSGYNNTVTSTNPGQKLKYNGKEYQDELGLNMYDYGARNYDPAIGRWMNIDPLAEISRRFSPYTYALDNPVYFIDPDGMKAEASQTANIYYDWDEGGYRTQGGETSTQEEALADNDDIINLDSKGKVTSVVKKAGDNEIYQNGKKVEDVDSKTEKAKGIKRGDIIEDGELFRIVPNVKILRQDIDINADDKYGHWWVEIGKTESYGWWPKEPVGLSDTVSGVPGELNGQTNFGGSPTRDPHHGFRVSGVNVFNLYTTNASSTVGVDIKIRDFANSYRGSWSWPVGQNCHSFQNSFIKKFNLTINP
jgi:RHS repeat-associated protein